MNDQLPLEDIILPPAVSAWPPAPGWWLLGLLLLTALLLLLVWAWRHWQYRRRLQRALHQLQRCRSAQGPELCRLVNEWLKQQARTRFPEALVLHGEDWVNFLNHSAGRSLFQGEPARALASGIYQPDTDPDADELLRLAGQWLQASRALKGVRA